ncbi:ELWxxDGT repeat protein [Lacipirellula sp.]|uniref:ELWxxDGT repeat protein n=1 Tax=Lacipirellula sp. TaxID=2691419 RepID=UPI003D14C4CD
MKKHRSQISRRERRRRQAQSLRQQGVRALGLESLESRYALSSVPILVDLNLTGASTPTDFTQVGGVTYFAANNGVNGRELWKTDGTPQGTSMVVDIRAGAGSSEPSSLVNVGGVLYFAANDGANGVELWRTDGTVAGTQMVKDIFTGTYAANYQAIPNSSLPTQLTNVGGKLFFTARNGVSGIELWTSDGTAAGTTMVRNIHADGGGTPSSSNPLQLTNYNSQLFFTADDGVNGRELWKSDGTEAGTVLVKDIRVGTYEYTPSGGGSAQTRPAPSNPGLLHVMNGTLYFVANDGTHGAELWKSDGTAAGTSLVKDIRSGADSPFTTSSVMEVVGNLLMFTANDGTHGDELWKSDGTEAGTTLVKDITPGATGYLSAFAGFEVIDGVLYFAADNTVNGKELWKSDGTEAGTVMIADVFPGTAANSSFPIYMTQANGTLYFSAFTSAAGRELWQYTPAGGAKIVADVVTGVDSFDPNQLVAINGKLFFSGLVNSGRELFTLVDAEQYQLSIYVDGVAVTIPSTIGIKSNGVTTSSFTSSQGGKINYTGGAGTTLGQFFDIWRTDAGLAGNNANAVFSATQILGNVATSQKTVQMFVNGQVVRDFASYQVQAGDDVVIIYGSNPVVSLNTTYGSILIELYETDTPITVANFLNYIKDGDYLNSLFHRVDSDFVIQGGGYKTSSTTYSGSGTSQFTEIPTDPQIQNEFKLSNVRGTIAMAKLGGQVNSATSQFFVNLSDSNSFLDLPANNSFTVFGKILSMATVDAIASLPINTSNASPFGELPVGADGKLAVVQSIEGLGDVSGVRFVDLNGNGTQDSGEEGLAGAVIYVDANNNGVQDSNEVFTVTDDDGKYRLQLEPGTYTIRMVVSAQGTQTSPAAGAAHTVTVEIGVDLNNRNFGESIILAPTGVTLAAPSDTGSSDSDRITTLNNSAGRQLTFVVSGVAPGGEVRLYAGDTLIGSAVSTGSTVTIVTNGTVTLTDGVHEISARQTLSGSESSASSPLSVTIDTTAPAPISTTPGATVAFGDTYEYDPASTSEGLTGVTYSLLNAPTGMTINAATGAIQWTPTAQQAMTHQFVIRLSDVAGNAALQTVVLTVTGDIVVMPDNYTVAEDGTLTVPAATGVLDNDGSGETLTAVLVTEPANGTLTLNADGSFTYTPDADFFGTDTFTYKAKNGAIEGNVATVTINVTAVSDPPVGVADNYTTNEDTPLTVPVADGVLKNDSDPDDETLTVTVNTAPAHGTLALNPDGSFVYTPAGNYNGTDTFTYRISDGTNTSDPITVTINVTAVNDSPVGVADQYTVNEETTLTVNVADGVLKNDSDPEGDAMTVVVAENPSSGTLTLNANGSFTYVPAANFQGTVTFKYRVKDATGQSEPVTVTINVVNTNDAPTATADAKTVANDGTTQTVDVLANDTDPDGDDLKVTAVTQGSQGGVVAIGTNGANVTYKPASGFTGTETFTYTITDEGGATKTATVTMTVTASTSTGVISGFVYFDADNDGVKDTGETGVPGVLITLTSTSTGTNITRTAITKNDGSYSFTALPAGTYKVVESQPAAMNDGIEKSADTGATITNDSIANIVLTAAETAANNNFGERLLKSEHTSIRWFFASSYATNDYFRQVIARGEDAAGNGELATAIRNGDTTFTPSSASAATLTSASLLAEEEAANVAEDSSSDESLAGLAFASLVGADEDGDESDVVAERTLDESAADDSSSDELPLSLHEEGATSGDLIDAANESTDGEIDAIDAAFAELQSGLAA